ncbi:hypothetical protein [Macrococcoides caseolyticum]|uniref:hypothetical protein n=1 Tax=Macrococcoides caseolyticum TaxID=69966 RepID=UPI0011D0E547|nr:hypothetical protein [Macrococcus caseolyticus]
MTIRKSEDGEKTLNIVQSVTMYISSIERLEMVMVARLSFVTGGDEMIPDNESIRYEMEKLFTSTIEDESYIVVEREEDDEEEEE